MCIVSEPRAVVAADFESGGAEVERYGYQSAWRGYGGGAAGPGYVNPAKAKDEFPAASGGIARSPRKYLKAEHSQTYFLCVLGTLDTGKKQNNHSICNREFQSECFIQLEPNWAIVTLHK